MRDGLRVLDSDIHVLEPEALWAEYLDPGYLYLAPRRPESGQGWWESDGRVFPAHADDPDRARSMKLRFGSERFRKRLDERPPEELEFMINGTTPEAMLGAMAVEGIDVAVVFRTYAAHLISIDDQDPAAAAALCRAFNRWGTDFCSAEPDRLKLGAQIPLHDVDVAVAEARFAVDELGATTLVLPSHMVQERPAYHPDYDAFWDCAADLDVAVSFHGIQSSYTAGMLSSRYHDNHVLGHAVGQPVEMMLSLGEVVAGGVAARRPELRFAFLEGNCSWLPWWLYALDSRWKEWGDEERFDQHELPSEVFTRQCYASVDVDEHLVTDVIDAIGDTNLVVSTDWPHDDSEYPHALDEFLAIPGLSEESRRKILWDNTARLYGLEHVSGIYSERSPAGRPTTRR